MTKEQLTEYYVNQDHNLEETASYFNTSRYSITWSCRKWNIRKKEYHPRSSEGRDPVTLICQSCGKEFTSSNKTRAFCSNECKGNFRHKSRYQFYLDNQQDFYGQQTMRSFYKEFLKDQQGCCAICGIPNNWNSKNLTFIIDHIDGNADNNNRENLRLICPNCDSQLDTYKSKNKNSARRKHRSDRISLYDPKV